LVRTFARRQALLSFLLIIPSPSKQISKKYLFLKKEQATISGVDKAPATPLRRGRRESGKPTQKYSIRKVFVGSLGPDFFLLT
jgi:hypothetical protein